MGIKGFWDMVNIAENEHLSMRDHVMQVPPVGRVRCLEALMAEVEAAPPPESLRHSVDMQDKIDIMAEYRGMLERVLRKHMLHVWQSCARQLFAAADPVKFIAGGASGINADAPRGLDEKDVAGRELLDTISTLELDRWPNWYTAQYDALVVQPGLVHSVLNNDENQPARVWREGRAKASGGGRWETKAVPQECAWAASFEAKENKPKRHPSTVGALDWWLAASCRLRALVPASGHRLCTGVARHHCRQPRGGAHLAVVVCHDVSRDFGVRPRATGPPRRHRQVVRVDEDVP